jgi:putative tRNA adenosine deaminase-associated protein
MRATYRDGTGPPVTFPSRRACDLPVVPRVWWAPRRWCHHDAVAYFTAVVARAGSAWRARDVELDEAGGDLDGLADVLRSVAVDDEPVIAVLEHEDEWFALFRVDGDEEPRLFVSDLPAASLSGYAELLAPAADVQLAGDASEPATEAEAEADDEDDDGGSAPVVVTAAWAGDADLLEDLGVSGTALRRLVEQHGEDPAAVLVDVGEQIGFGELLEALR